MFYHFFCKPWIQTRSALEQGEQLYILKKTGLVLRSQSRLEEASKALEAALKGYKELGDCKNAADTIRHLVQLYLIKGEFKNALEKAHYYVELADKSKVLFFRMACRATLANVLHQQGLIKKAADEFLEAERIQKKWKPNYPLLLWLHGYRYLDLLIEMGDYEQVLNRIKKTLKWKLHNDFLMANALYRITLARTEILMSRVGRIDDEVIINLNNAFRDLRQARQIDFLPRGFLVRAEIYRLNGNFSKAWDDLDEAREIAEQGSMKLYLADYHLEAAKLCLAESKKEEAQSHLTTAKEMINNMGYHRRDKEVKELEEKLK